MSEMIVTYGNCQAQLIADGIAERRPGCRVKTVLLAATGTHLSGVDPAAFLRKFPQIPEDKADGLFLARHLDNQFAFITQPGYVPEKIILTLFHDSSPLFRDNETGSTFYVNRPVARTLPELEKWLEGNCAPITEDPDTYFRRYSRFLELVRSKFPVTPILLLVRCRHLSAYAPTPYSYLASWDGMQKELPAALAEYQQRFQPFSVLELDSVIGGYVRRAGPSISRVFPTVLLNPSVARERKGFDANWRNERLQARDFDALLQRDVEHPCTEVWNRAGEIAATWCETGALVYDEIEFPLENSFSSTSANLPELHNQRELLISGATTLDWQIFFEGLIYTLPADQSSMIAELGTYAPQDKYLLRAVRAYAFLNPSEPMLRFLDDYLAKLGPSAKGNRDARVVTDAIDRVRHAMALGANQTSFASTTEKQAETLKEIEPLGTLPKIAFVVRAGNLARFISPIIRFMAGRAEVTVVTGDPGYEEWATQFPNVTFVKIRSSKSPLNREGTRALRAYLDWVRLGRHDWTYLEKYFLSFPEKKRPLWRLLHRLRLTKLLALPFQQKLKAVEDKEKPDEKIAAQLKKLAPDLLLVSPVVFPNSSDFDYLKAGVAAGIPSAALIPSWDNLTTKGTFQVKPDWVFVWNDIQKRECTEYHGMKPEQILMCGAPSFDGVYAKTGLVPREQFCAAAGLPPDKPFILWAASSMGGRDESAIVSALASRTKEVTNILVRPHPKYSEVWQNTKFSSDNVFVWPGSRFAEDESAAGDIVNSVYHSKAVIGLSTSMFLEAAILDRPSALIQTPEHGTDWHTNYLHFEYLLQTGFVEVCERESDMADWVKRVVPDGDGLSQARADYAHRFLRPTDPQRSAADVTADTILGLVKP